MDGKIEDSESLKGLSSKLATAGRQCTCSGWYDGAGDDLAGTGRAVCGLPRPASAPGPASLCQSRAASAAAMREELHNTTNGEIAAGFRRLIVL